MYRYVLTWLLLATTLPAAALDLSAIANGDAVSALRTALTQGSTKAVTKLGVENGFLGNPEVKIPLPPNLRKAEKTLRRLGMGAQADELITAMNRAAEAAVPEARTLLVDAVKSMSVQDAKSILTGGDDAATQYFRAKTATALFQKFKPTITQATSKVGLANTYNNYAGRAAKYGLLSTQEGNLDDYVTGQALDGLYKMIAAEEKAIRQDPLGQSSKILQRVFGAK
jgi:hypothetical protein